MDRREFITTTAVSSIIASIPGCTQPTNHEFQAKSYVDGENWPLDRANPQNTATVDVKIEWPDSVDETAIVQTNGIISNIVSVNNYLWYTGNNIVLYNIQSNQTVWEVNPQAQINVSPAIANNRVYQGTLRNMMSYSQENGNVLWSTAQDVVDTSPITYGKYIFCENKSNQQLEKKSAKTGETLAKYTTDHSLQGIAVSNERLYLTQMGESTGKVVSIDWHGDTTDWTFSDCGRIMSAPVLTADFVIVGSQDGSVYCLDRNSGDVNWATKVVSQSEGVFTDIAISDDAVLISANNGDTCLALEIMTGDLRWETKTGESMLGPICDSESVFTANRDILYRLETESGEKLNQTTFNSEIQDLCLTKNGLFVAAGSSVHNLSR